MAEQIAAREWYTRAIVRILDKRVERVQLRMFDEMAAGQKKTEVTLEEVVKALKDHKTHIEALAAGQQQIISLLTGQVSRND